MKKELEQLLMQEPTFLVEGTLNKNKLSELARKYDAKLLEILMQKELVKQQFFVTLGRTADSGQRTADSGQRTADSGQRTADSGQRTADSGQRTADSGQ
ncbi:hypothetical protein NHG24_08720, partial [Aerococcaceae bacterium NML210727]|nr:hypothetical protein [Aerococcaceae bacterium NML210727]MCW6665930.1 hypothetical protein [Aerococcaceae bacterium NML191219]